MRRTPEITLPLRLDRDSPDPLPAQLSDRLRALVADGVLVPGDALPSTRALAAHLAVSRGSVVTAYDQLLAEGYLSAASGRSTMVNPLLRPGASPKHSAPLPRHPAGTRARPPSRAAVGGGGRRGRLEVGLETASACRPGRPRARRPALRRAWAEHLRLMRAVVVDPAQIAVTGGGPRGPRPAPALARPGAAAARRGRGTRLPSLRRVPPGSAPIWCRSRWIRVSCG